MIDWAQGPAWRDEPIVVRHACSNMAFTCKWTRELSSEAAACVLVWMVPLFMVRCVSYIHRQRAEWLWPWIYLASWGRGTVKSCLVPSKEEMVLAGSFVFVNECPSQPAIDLTSLVQKILKVILTSLEEILLSDLLKMILWAFGVLWCHFKKHLG